MISRILIKVLCCTGGTAFVFGLLVHVLNYYDETPIVPYEGEIYFTDAEKQMIQEAIDNHRLSREDLEEFRTRVRLTIDHPARVKLALDATWWSDDFREREQVLIAREKVFGCALVGAFFGMLWGISWSISHNAARWHFLGWTVAGLGITEVVRNFLEHYTPSGVSDDWQIVIILAGIGVGIVTALDSAGVFARFKDGK